MTMQEGSFWTNSSKNFNRFVVPCKYIFVQGSKTIDKSNRSSQFLNQKLPTYKWTILSVKFTKQTEIYFLLQIFGVLVVWLSWAVLTRY